jgi:hypothetical protein
MRSSSADSRSSSKRRASAAANGSFRTSASAGPRQSASASRGTRAASPSEPARGRSPALLGQPLEAFQVELPGLCTQDVAGRPSLDALGAQSLAQTRDVVVEAMVGICRQPVSPEPLDQAVARDRLVRLEQEHCEQRPRLGPAERDILAVALDRDRTEEHDVH